MALAMQRFGSSHCESEWLTASFSLLEKIAFEPVDLLEETLTVSSGLRVLTIPLTTQLGLFFFR
jgi:hypothetical protein